MIILACLVFGVAVTTALIVDIYTGSHHTGTRSFHFYFAQISLCSLSTIAKHCSNTFFADFHIVSKKHTQQVRTTTKITSAKTHQF